MRMMRQALSVRVAVSAATVCVVAAFAVAASGCGTTDRTANDASRPGVYRSDKYGWQIQYGPDFTVSHETMLGASHGRHGLMVRFARPGYGDSAWLGPGELEVIAGSLAHSTTPEAYVQRTAAFNRELEAMRRNGVEGESLTIVSPYRQTRLAGYPALAATYGLSLKGHPQDKLAMRVEIYVIGAGTYEYQIRLTASQEQWQTDRPDLLRLANAFRLLDQ
jgi:hypothetical protein